MESCRLKKEKWAIWRKAEYWIIQPKMQWKCLKISFLFVFDVTENCWEIRREFKRKEKHIKSMKSCNSFKQIYFYASTGSFEYREQFSAEVDGKSRKKKKKKPFKTEKANIFTFPFRYV